MSSKSLALVAVASLCFAGCTVQPRAAAPAAPVAVAPPPAPAQTPIAQPATKPDAKKNARQKSSSGSAAADATKYWSYEDVKRALKKEDGSGNAAEMMKGKVAKLTAKKAKQAGSFYVVRRDEIYFTCDGASAANVKNGTITGTLRGTEFWDGPVLTIVYLDNCAPA